MVRETIALDARLGRAGPESEGRDTRRRWQRPEGSWATRSMGDFLAPKRRDVVDRLRRRIEQYRCHHLQAGRRFDSSRLGLFEQQRQDSQHLHQRWLENKAKKAAKHSKVKDTSGTGAAASSSQTEHRNLVTVSGDSS